MILYKKGKKKDSIYNRKKIRRSENEQKDDICTGIL